jgi:hypothetical protein
MKRSSPVRLRNVLALACLLAGLPAAAETLLLVVQDGADSRPLPQPSPVREGLTGDLFDAGYIVLDAPTSTPFPGAAELSQLARSAGADFVVAVVTDYTDTPLPLDYLRITARTSYSLIDASTSVVIAHGTRDATNKDRERNVTRVLLGAEIGTDVAAQVKAFLEGRDSR